MRSPITISAPSCHRRHEARDLLEVIRQVGVGHHDVAARARPRTPPGRRCRSRACVRPRRAHPPARPGARSRPRSRCPRPRPRRCTPIRSIASSAAATQDSMFSASFRQGITTDTSGASASWSSGAVGVLVWASVLIGCRLSGPASYRRTGASYPVITRAKAESGVECENRCYRSDSACLRMRVCVVYDCLFPHTVGGAERWYRNLAERLVEEGHEVTYLTLRQWDRGETPDLAGGRARVVSVGPRMSLYTQDGRRRVAPPLVFGLGVLWHLLRQGGRYDVVHMRLVPLLLAARRRRARPARALYARRSTGSRSGAAATGASTWAVSAGEIGCAVQRVCARVPQRAFCFSQLHAARLRGRGTARRGDGAGGRVRRLTRPAGRAAGRAAGGLRRAHDPREARARRRRRRGRGRQADRGAAGNVLRRRARA